MERALLEYRQNNLDKVKEYCLKALEIKTHQKSYINEIFSWDHTVYDLLSICYFQENKLDDSLLYIEKAREFSPDNERLIENKKIIQKSIKNN